MTRFTDLREHEQDALIAALHARGTCGPPDYDVRGEPEYEGRVPLPWAVVAGALFVGTVLGAGVAWIGNWIREVMK